MKKIVAISLLLLMMGLTVPWFFIGEEEFTVLGLPGWAAYGLGMLLIFPFAGVILLRRYWDDLASGPELD